MKKLICIILAVVIIGILISSLELFDLFKTNNEYTVEESQTETETEPESQIEDEVETPTHITIDISKTTNTVEDKLESFGNYTAKQLESLKKIQKLVNDSPNKISVIGYTIDGTQSFCINSDHEHSSACTIKAGYCLALCKYFEEYGVDIQRELTYTPDKYYGGTGTIQKDPFGSTYTIENLVYLCLSISDNVAYKMLLDEFGIDYYNDYITSIGATSLKLKNTSMFVNRVHPKDYALVWAEIYNYFNSDGIYVDLLKKSCTNTRLNYFSKNLTEWDYSHKSGENDWQLNDAGIIWADKPYILIIFTNASYTNTANKEIVTNICDLVHYKLFNYIEE